MNRLLNVQLLLTNDHVRIPCKLKKNVLIANNGFYLEFLFSSTDIKFRYVQCNKNLKSFCNNKIFFQQKKNTTHKKHIKRISIMYTL